ncbi:mitochondrial amidoxime reducing component 2 isoform X2 [Drosophila hydei]|uniref:Mitochondrial amidoxime reducing component 2 isoform X2 n=1 Tax=Drosophila hydei TaxID=7224 RepID=A0A6J2STU5_DROHY|nr:mitochondrial amidoxime reducing component 2 isoform X2 [Drosophila hydei]
MNRNISLNGYGLSNKMLIGMGVSLVAVGGAGYLVYRHLHRDLMPVKWRRVGTLQRVNVFPVKSCAPLEHDSQQEYDCDVLGIGIGNVRDRKFMLVNDNNEMITARAYPHMVLIQPKAVANGLVFSAPGMPDLELDFKHLESPSKDVHTSVWGVAIDVMLCGSRFDKWFSEFILKKDSGVKLVYYPYPGPVRATNPRLKHMPYIKQDDSGTLNDATSYMLMNLASIDDLNTRLKTPVDALQFRGNFELKMDVDQPYSEDHWQWIRIGNDAIFRIVAPCTRCILPNINVKTAERNVDGEPLKTLRSYRLFDYPSPALGIHLGLRQAGNVKVNDVIYVEDK